jgi:hypothetical protein
VWLRRAELEQQIREARERRQRERQRRVEEDLRKEAEIAQSERWAGRQGGGGAPLVDNLGDTITDLNEVHLGAPFGCVRVAAFTNLPIYQFTNLPI